MSSSIVLLTAIYDRLKADATLKTLIEAARGATLNTPLPIYLLQAPPDEPLPVITFNEVSRVAFDTSDSVGGEHTIDVHCYSGAASPKEAYDILARVEALLLDPAITLSGFSLVHCRLSSLRCDVDQDGSYHGVATFRALTSQ